MRNDLNCLETLMDLTYSSICIWKAADCGQNTDNLDNLDILDIPSKLKSSIPIVSVCGPLSNYSCVQSFVLHYKDTDDCENHNS